MQQTRHHMGYIKILLPLICILLLYKTPVFAETGSEITWTVDNGTLTISGSGEMENYAKPEEVPWYNDYVKEYFGSDEGAIKSIVIESGVTSIGSYAFYNCQHVTSIVIPTSVEKIGDYVFYNCQSLPEKMEIPSSVKKIGSNVFEKCSSFVSISVGSSDSYFTTYGAYVFKDCANLKTIDFRKNSIVGLDYTSFEGCSSLVTFRFSVFENIYGPYRIFSNMLCKYSNSDSYNVLIKCPETNGYADSDYYVNSATDSVSEIGHCSFSNTKVKTLDATYIEVIGDGAFQNCKYLEDVTLGMKLRKIGSYAFADCPKISTITIPGCVDSIGENAFQNCSSLETVYFRGDVPTITSSIFSSDVSVTIYYPEDNLTWTEEVKKQFGGNITWVGYSPSLSEFSESKIDVTLNNTTYDYDGNEINVSYSVYLKDSSFSKYPYTHKLFKDIEYSVDYENNIESGTATIIFEGMGEFSGAIKKQFAIKPVVTLGTSNLIYNKKPQYLDISVKGNATLYFSTITPLTYENYKEEGTTDIPSRTSAGTTDVYYIAVSNNNPSEESCVIGSTQLVVEKGKQEIGAEVESSSIFVGETKRIISSSSAGAITYESSNPNIASVDDDGIVTGISEGKTKIIIRAAETANYKEESKEIVITVDVPVETSISECVIEVENNLVYSNTAVEANVLIKYNGHVLVKDQDYSVEYYNNTSPGTGTVKITGKGYYIGSITKTFTIIDGNETQIKKIASCDIVLADTKHVYNGKEQTQGVIVKDGSYELVEGKDYNISYSDNISAGQANIILTGIGDYEGTTTKTFDIQRADAILAFEFSKVNKTTDDSPFIINLDAKTDGAVTYSSADESVATINTSTGKVTITGAGTTVIRATSAAGKNYKAGEASYTLTVTEKEKQLSLSIENLSYSFGNTASSFGYPAKYNYSSNVYEMIFGKTTKATFWYDRDLEITGGIWRGNCAGFSGTSALMMDSSSGIKVTDFDSSAKSIGQLSPKNKSSSHGLDVTGFIEAMQIAQHTQLFTNEISKNRIYTSKHLNKQLKNLNGLYQTVRTETEAGRPVILALYQTGAHAVLAYEVKDISETESQILLYDSNWPGEERVLTLKKDTNGNYMEWSYEIGRSYGTWGTDNRSSSISYVPYSVIKEIWSTKGHLKENENVLSINSGSVAIYTNGDKPVATVTQGELSTTIDDIHVIDYLSLERADSDTLLLSVPVDVYTFQNLDKSVDEFEVSMANTNLGAKALTTAESITMAVDDSCNLNAVYIDAGENDEYSITLNSSFSYDEDNVVVTGKGNGETMEVSQTKGNININNCQITSISIDGKQIDKYQIKASAGIGGKITPEGETVVTEGETVSYHIEPLSGYVISNVYVDGKSVGSVSTYEFNHITSNHEIKAEFKKKAPAESSTENKEEGTTVDSGKTNETKEEPVAPAKKSPNKITAKNFVLTYSNKSRSFYLKATAKGNAKLSYSSNHRSVKVASNGKVTIAKKFVGKASIRIKSAATNSYEQASKVITVTVNPTGTTINSLKKSGTGKMIVGWKRNSTVTGYQINYSISPNFKNAKTVTIKNNKTVKTVLKKLSRKKKYYVRIRTYKVVSGKKYYSVWSKKKAVKV